jgi:predicted nucleic acid-binding protein
MMLIDANLLIYAIDADSPHHRAARKWLEEALLRNSWNINLAGPFAEIRG